MKVPLVLTSEVCSIIKSEMKDTFASTISFTNQKADKSYANQKMHLPKQNFGKARDKFISKQKLNNLWE